MSSALTSQRTSSPSIISFPCYRLGSIVAFEQLQTADRAFLRQYPDLFLSQSALRNSETTSTERIGSRDTQPLASGTVQLAKDRALLERTRQLHLEGFVSRQRDDIEGLLYRLQRYQGWYDELNSRQALSEKSLKSPDSIDMAIKDLCEIDLLHSIINTCGQKLRAILEAYVFQSDLFLWIQQVNGWLATSDNSQEVKRIRECVIIKAAMDITNVRNVNASSSFRGLGKSSLVSIGRQAPQVSVESYLNNVAGTQVVGYNCVASLAFLIYDILLTLHQEVTVVWPISWNLTKCLFFFIRYFPVILQISVLFVGTPPFTFTKRECYIWNVYQGLATVLIVAAVDYILILRIFALYSRSRIIRYLVATLYLLELVTMSIGVGLAVPNLGYDDLCTLIDVPDTFLIAAGAPIAFQTILFGLTAWRFLEAVKAGWGNVPIIQLLMRDGTWAFILLFAILLGEAFLYGFAPEAYTDVLYGWLNTAFAFCGYRILLNLNQLNASARPSIYVTSPDIVFSSQVITGPFSEESYQLTNLSPSPISSTPGTSSQSDARQSDRDE